MHSNSAEVSIVTFSLTFRQKDNVKMYRIVSILKNVDIMMTYHVATSNWDVSGENET